MNRRLQFVLSFLALMFLSVGTSWSQPIGSSLSCNANINVSLGLDDDEDPECEATICPGDFNTLYTQGPYRVIIFLDDFGLKAGLHDTIIDKIFDNYGEITFVNGRKAVVGDELGCIVINTSEITASRVRSGRKAFKAVGVWPTKVTVAFMEGDNIINSCWGMATIEDKLPPLIDCPDDITVSCLVTADAKGNPALSVTGDVDATNACSDVTKEGYIDVVQNFPCSAQSLVLKRIERTFVVEKANGQQSSCKQNITVMAVDLDEELSGPQPLVVISCEDGHTPADIAAALGDSVGYPHVLAIDTFSGNGEPKFTAYPLKPNVAVCNVVATFSDIKLYACKDNCEGTVKIARTWTVLDWCQGASITYSQLIKKVDDEAPVIEDIADPAPYTVNAWGCDVDILLPSPDVTDNCDPDATIVKVEGILNNNPNISEPPTSGSEVLITVTKQANGRWLAKKVPYGYHTFVYTASDCCGNTVSSTIDVTVEDKVAPVASAKEYITLSLSHSGNAAPADLGSGKLLATQVDNGSYDNCTPVKLEIRRDGGENCYNEGDEGHNNNLTFDNSGHPQDDDLDTDNGEYVKFCCSDLNQVENGVSYGIHKVILRVWDDADGDGEFGSEGDNYNETWTNVRVEDKIVPRIACPSSITTYCDRDTGVVPVYSFGKWTTMTDENTPKDFQPTATGVCGSYTFEFKDAGDLDVCGSGEFERTYRIVGFTSVTCKVYITVEPSRNSPRLEFPVSLHEWNSCVLTEADVNLNTVRARIDESDELGWEGCNPEPVVVTTGPASVNNGGYCSTDGYDDASDEDAYLPYNTNQGTGKRKTRNLPLSTSLNPVNTPSGAPRFNSSYKDPGCNVFGKRMTIEEYTVGEGCRKWLVTWDYINWCCNEKSACRSTVYKYEDKLAPEIKVCDGDNVDIVNGVTCTQSVTLNPEGFDAGLCESGLTWRVRIYPFNASASGSSYVEIVNTKYDLGAGKASSTDRLIGSTPSLNITNVPAGVHGVRYLLRDGCGNVTECTATITVLPKDPTPYCISLSSAVMKNGLVELWAIDFDKGSFQNCTTGNTGVRVVNDSVRIDNSILFYTFNNKKTGAPEHPVVTRLHREHYFKGYGVLATADEYNAGDAQIWKPVVDVRVRPLLPDGSVNPLSRNEYTIVAGSSSGMQFGCKAGDVANGVPFPVEMRVWDVRSGLFIPGTDEGSDFCRVMLSLVDNQGACNADGSLSVKGMVATSKGDGVTGVETKLAANLPEFPVVSNTQNGAFSFAKVPAGVEFELSARKNNDHINGVNTLDLVTIQRHILGIAKLGDAYKYVAADADNNQKINLSDLVELRKLVLGITNELPNNTSWRFVDAAQKFADISNPWPLDEVIVTTANANTNDFVAVKVGDVNIDAAANATSTNLVSRSASTVKFVVDQATINAGEVVSIPVRAANFNEAYGFQMTTELKGLELVNVQSGAIAVEEGMVATPKAGVMTMSWTAANGATVSDDAVLFTINVRAKSTVEVSRAIAITSSVTEAVAFTGSDLTAGNVELEVRGAGSSAYALGQNEPNPFKAETTIKFSMPEAGEAKFRVVDVTGRVLVNEVIKAAKGENVITLKRADIAATGVVYYQIESGDFTATKKMVIIE